MYACVCTKLYHGSLINLYIIKRLILPMCGMIHMIVDKNSTLLGEWCVIQSKPLCACVRACVHACMRERWDKYLIRTRNSKLRSYINGSHGEAVCVVDDERVGRRPPARPRHEAH